MASKDDVIRRVFTAGQAEKATGVPYYTINYWARSGLLVPSAQEANGSNTCRGYSFQDLVALRVARQLREAGVSLQGLRKAVSFLQKRYKHPLAEAYLVVSGDGDVVVKSHEQLLSALRSPGQAYFVYALSEAVSELTAIARTLKAPTGGKASAVS